jgi:UDPglucose 6-dehydrogenase
MRIGIIGTGYVGLVSGACFSEFGFEVTCVDQDLSKIERLRRGEIPIYEPGLDDLVKKNVADGRLKFDTDTAKAVDGADAVFIAVGTPARRGDGHADLSYVFAATEEIAAAIREPTVVVTKSTVPVGTGRKVAAILAERLPESKFEVASNPEFLREGSAIQDFMRPDRVIIGAETERAQALMRELYRPLYLNETPILFTSLETAELVKYAANSFLATKIAFINEIADLCERVGADVQDVAKGMGLDGRIGRKFLHVSPGFGGSCFPKDCLALAKTASQVDASVTIVDAAMKSNERRKHGMAERVIAACGGTVADKTVAVLGLTFKPNTDDMRESASLAIVPALRSAGATIRAYDPAGMDEARRLLAGVEFCADSYEALSGAHALVILTEWNEFRALDLHRVKALLKSPTIIDLRNIYKPADMADAGFHYFSIGRPAVGPLRHERISRAAYRA